jgi:hypothetical protein
MRKVQPHWVTIERARRLALGVTDQLTIERLKAMVEDLQTEKTALHRDRDSQRA